MHSHLCFNSYICPNDYLDSPGSGCAGNRERQRVELDRSAECSPLRTAGLGQRQQFVSSWRKLPERHDLHEYRHYCQNDLFLHHPLSERRRLSSAYSPNLSMTAAKDGLTPQHTATSAATSTPAST